MEKDWESGFTIANEHMQEILDKVEDDDSHLFIATEVTGFRAWIRISLRSAWCQ